MQVGIIGLPNVGKSTIFNALAKESAEVANFPFSTIEPNLGIINVPDDNLVTLSAIYKSGKITYPSINIMDVAGLVKGASNGEGLGNKFLSHVREADVVVHVIRCFYDENVSHLTSGINPGEDMKTIMTELLLADMETLERKKEKLISISKSGDSNSRSSLEIINYLLAEFDAGKLDLNAINKITEKNMELIKELNLISLKPTLCVANVNEKKESNILYEELLGNMPDLEVIKINGKVENELLEIPENERDYYRKEFGIPEDSLRQFIRKCYDMLDLITFYTGNEKEVRAWPIKKNSTAMEAAGKIHSDILKGFVKAEVINSKELIQFGSLHLAREGGKIRIEGKEYVVSDGDMIQVKFSI